MTSKGKSREEENPRFAMTWVQISELAEGMKWPELKTEVSKKLDEDEIKLQRMRIPIDFEELGFRILRIAATTNPTGKWDERLAVLEVRASELLGGRSGLLPYVQKRSEQMQALIAINTSAAWAEFASILRNDLGKPRWALEAAAVALDKDSSNQAALTVKIAASGDIGEFEQAHQAYETVAGLNPMSNHASNAIAKVEMREGRFDEAVRHAMRAFFSSPNSATARLIGNIYRQGGMTDLAHKWYADAEFIEGPQDEKVTQAHIRGLLKLAEERLRVPGVERQGL